ncbi:MAG: type IX secretion system protein PorQ [Catalinimonas sp.]
MRLLLLLLLLPTALFAQIGGRASFDFLNRPVNARLLAEGIQNVSLYDQDPNLMQANPALLNEQMDKHLSINWSPYYADINAFAGAYAFNTERWGPVGVQFVYYGYGTLPETDPTGAVIGEFTAADYALAVTKSHVLGNYSVGGTVRLAGSQLADYQAFAAMLDLGAAFHHPTRDFHVGLTVRNVGATFDPYVPGGIRPPLPLHVALGMSYKLEHMPLRFSITAHNLQQPDIVYLDPNQPGVLNADGVEVKEEKTIGDQILRHFSFGGEFLLSKNFHLRAGYNHLMRRELRLESRSGGAGFALGAMLRVKAFECAFTRSFYHVVGGTSTLTVTSNLASVFRNRTPKDQ